MSSHVEALLDVSVIVPVFNEEDSVGPIYEALRAELERTPASFEILFVDDGSSDRTVEVLSALAAKDPRVAIVKFRRNHGQTAAMTAGIEHARGAVLVTMDGDLQNDPADIPGMLATLDDGYDLVVGWRVNRQDKLLSRKLPSKLANWLIGRVTGVPIRDNGCSLKVYRAEMIKRVPLYSDMHRFIPAMTLPLGARIAQIGVRHHARRFGESKYGLSRIFKVVLDLIVVKTLLLFARRPLASFSGLAVALAAATVVLGALIATGEPGAGSMVVQMAVLGLLGSLTVFVLLLGMIATVAFQSAGAGREEASATGAGVARA